MLPPLRRFGGLYSSAIFCVGLFATFAGQLILGKVLSPEDFGTYILIYSVAAILSAVGAAGLDVSAVRFVSVAHAKNDDNELRGFILYAIRLAAVLSIAAALGGALYLYFVDSVSGTLLLLSIGIILIWGATRSLSGILRGMGGLSLAIGLDRVARDLAVFLAALAMLLLAWTATLIEALTALFLGGLAGLLVGGIALWRKFHILRVESSTGTTSEQAKEWRNTSFGLMTYNLTELLSSRFDIIFLSIFLPKDEIGALGILVILMNICAIPSVFIGIFIMPKLAVLGSTRDHRGLRQICLFSTAASVGFGALISLVLIALKDPMLEFIGLGLTRYVSTEILVAALVIRCLSLVGAFPAAYLTMTGGHRKLQIVNFFSVALRAIFYLLLFSQLGAAMGILAFVGAALVVSLVNFALIRREVLSAT
jgi:O-antigen/teichoic acid export membrane protein